MGGLAGVLVDRAWLVPRETPLGPGPFGVGRAGAGRAAVVGRNLARLDRRLDLSADQERQLAAIFEKWVERAGTLQLEARQRFQIEQDALRRDIEAVLTPDQVARFREMNLEAPRGGGPGRGSGRGPRPGRE
jgi:hypothetical protein